MGNQSCGINHHFLTMSLMEKTQLTKEFEMEDRKRKERSEDIGEEDAQIDQCSPFSKYDIKFLKTSIRASNIQKSEDIQSSISIRAFYPALKQKNKAFDFRKTLCLWSKATQLARSQKEQVELAETQKLKALQEYTNFLLKIEDQLKNEQMKFSREILYKIKNQPISDYYQMKQKIGQGGFGTVYIGKCLKSGQLRAIKVIKKKSMKKQDRKLLISEINILKKMDHINIIKLFLYVVTQYCNGGSLMEALISNQLKSEKEIVSVMKQIISGVRYMHQMKIAHRDLKLENIMLLKQDNQLEGGESRKIVKIIDFGLACSVNYTFRNKSGIVGTIDYMAPQLFLGYFSCYSDVWSCGIIICKLLIGINPFKKRSIEQTIKSIKQEEIDFTKPCWKRVSKMAIDLLALMLNKKQQKRISIDQAMENPWFRQVEEQQTSRAKSEIVISNLSSFNRGNNFICFVKNFLISRELTQDVRQEMAVIFQKIDTDSSGVIEKKQLMALYSLVTGVTDSQIERIFNRIDQNQSGRIDFQQFLICMTHNQMMRNQKYIDQAFNFLDCDQTGYIQKNQLLECLQGCEEKEFRKILRDLDFDGDGKISREEFKRYLINVQL